MAWQGGLLEANKLYKLIVFVYHFSDLGSSSNKLLQTRDSKLLHLKLKDSTPFGEPMAGPCVAVKGVPVLPDLSRSPGGWDRL